MYIYIYTCTHACMSISLKLSIKVMLACTCKLCRQYLLSENSDENWVSFDGDTLQRTTIIYCHHKVPDVADFIFITAVFIHIMRGKGTNEL